MVKVKIIKRYSDVLFRRTVEVGEVLDVTQERANHLVCADCEKRKGTGIMIQRYVVTREVDRLAPEWLADRFCNAIKVLYGSHDGYVEVKGVRIGDETAQIGDTIVFDGTRLSIERR